MQRLKGLKVLLPFILTGIIVLTGCAQEEASGGVTDVADAIGVGVRTLELIFRKTRRRTLHEEIIRTRLAEVRRLLQESDARIADIGYACGFGTSNNLKQLFKKRFGVTMREWRRQNRTM